MSARDFHEMRPSVAMCHVGCSPHRGIFFLLVSCVFWVLSHVLTVSCFFFPEFSVSSVFQFRLLAPQVCCALAWSTCAFHPPCGKHELVYLESAGVLTLTGSQVSYTEHDVV